MSESIYRVESFREAGETMYRLVGPGVRSDAKPSEDYRQKLEELAALLNHARAVWEEERQQSAVADTSPRTPPHQA
jgi:orotidine-5'-phosphate decarboxylase